MLPSQLSIADFATCLMKYLSNCSYLINNVTYASPLFIFTVPISSLYVYKFYNIIRVVVVVVISFCLLIHVTFSMLINISIIIIIIINYPTAYLIYLHCFPISTIAIIIITNKYSIGRDGCNNQFSTI